MTPTLPPSEWNPQPRGPTRTFALCIAASLALHAALLSELPSLTATFEPASPELDAEIVTLDRAPLVLPKPVPAPKPALKPAPAPRRAEPGAASTPVMTAPAQSAVAAAEPADPEPADAAPIEAPEVAETAPAAAPEPPEPAPPVAAAEPAPEPPAPQVGSIRYEVYFGSDRFSIGRSVQTWSIDKESYRLTSFSETTGLVGLFKPYQYAYVAEGRVEPGRLRPETFTVRRGREGERQASARFDWASGQLTFGRLGAQRKAPLDASSYDLLSLFYQLPHMPLAPGQVQVSITTGTRFNTYQLDIGAEEMLELPVGTLRTIPVKQVRKPGEESIEVWLALEQRYLPVRIRFLDEEGKLMVEQLATRIAVGTVAADGR